MRIASRYLISLLISVSIFLSGCASNTGSTDAARGIPAGDVDPQLFESPDDLVAALKDALNNDDTNALYKLLGSHGKNLLFSGDPVSDKIEIADLRKRVSERAELISASSSDYPKLRIMKLRIGRMGVNSSIPLINEGKGWRFATRYFVDSAVRHRMARNEIEAWRACSEYVEAQRDYFKIDRNGDGVLEYAQRFMSTFGKRDGLYWKVGSGEPRSPLDEVIAKATSQGYTGGSKEAPKPFHGYIFKILSRQGDDAREGKRNYMVDSRMTKGFALVAYPVEWGASGIRTIIVGPYGIIYSKNLGVATDKLASQMEEFNPDRSWSVVQNPQVNDYEEYLETL